MVARWQQRGDDIVHRKWPAAAVIRVVQALSGLIGRKGSAGGLVSLVLNPDAQRQGRIRYYQTRGWERLVELPV